MKKRFYALILVLALILITLGGCSISLGGSSALRGAWKCEGDSIRGFPDKMELLGTGKAMIDGADYLTWTAESGYLYISHPLADTTKYKYKISRSKLTLTDDDGDTQTYELVK